jgi:drug/metabolite transporter (DMT)-like permease
MITSAFLWSTAGIFFKLLPWHPMTIAGFRSLTAACVYFLFLRSQKVPFVINRYSLLSGFFLSGVFVSFIIANKLTTAANAIVLQYSAPAFILIISALFLHQKIKKGDIIAVAVTTFGVFLFFLDNISPGYLIGNLVALLSGLLYASMFVTNGQADDKSRSSGILLAHLITSAAGVPFAFISPTPITSVTLSTILALGIIQLGIPYLLYGIAARHCSALACSLIGTIEPLCNPIWVYIFNGEAPGIFALTGGFVVISAIISWSIWSSTAAEPDGEEK